MISDFMGKKVNCKPESPMSFIASMNNSSTVLSATSLFSKNEIDKALKENRHTLKMLSPKPFFRKTK
jgi:hypothetical protein